MGLFDMIAKKKPGEHAAPQPAFGANVPTEVVRQFRQQGLTNNQIIQNLQRQGFKSHQIFDALNQADMRAGPPAEQMQRPELPRADMPMPPLEEPVPQTFAMPEPQPAKPSEDVEELVEAIIDEKWQDLLKDVNKIVQWKGAMEKRMTVIDNRISDLQKEFESLRTALLEKINQYDKNIVDVGTELKSMEMVFRKVLPTFTENVSELKRITSNIRSQKPKKKSLDEL